jgi:hypothetical protein
MLEDARHPRRTPVSRSTPSFRRGERIPSVTPTRGLVTQQSPRYPPGADRRRRSVPTWRHVRVMVKRSRWRRAGWRSGPAWKRTRRRGLKDRRQVHGHRHDARFHRRHVFSVVQGSGPEGRGRRSRTNRLTRLPAGAAGAETNPDPRCVSRYSSDQPGAPSGPLGRP